MSQEDVDQIKVDGQAVGIIGLKATMEEMALKYTDKPDDQEGLYFLTGGAAGYTNTYISPERLKQAVTVAEHGGVWVSQSLMSRLITGMTPTEEKDAPVLEGVDLNPGEPSKSQTPGWLLETRIIK